MSKKILIFILIVSVLGLAFLFFSTSVLTDGDLTGKNGSPLLEEHTPTEPEGEDDDNDEPEKSLEQPKKEKPEDLPKVSIVIDDLGNSLSQDKKLASVEADLTLAILPLRENTQESLNFFKDKQEIILHLPLEPLSEEDKEINMITTDMTEEEIFEKLELALADLNHQVEGVNNHKGSLFTSNRKTMEILLNRIKKKDLFFLDSYTIASSEAYELAKEINLKTAQRDVFLDGSKKEEDIRARLQETIDLAKKNRAAVAIGHSRPATVDVLIEEIPKLKNQVEFVKVSEVLE
ncbi:MAG: divergent polysaccharide deacetylase family protein [Candidatus Moraniibacteriota bacterium]